MAESGACFGGDAPLEALVKGSAPSQGTLYETIMAISDQVYPILLEGEPDRFMKVFVASARRWLRIPSKAWRQATALARSARKRWSCHVGQRAPSELSSQSDPLDPYVWLIIETGQAKLSLLP